MICDSLGNSTQQTDFIVYDPALLPAITMSGNVGVIPIEAVHLQAEIKFTITTETLRQVHQQVATLYKLRIAHHGPRKSVKEIIIPTIVLEYSCKVAKNTLKDWLSASKERPNLVAVCVLGQYSLLRVGPDKVNIIDASDTDPTFTFLHKLYETLADVAESRRNFRADWTQYLEDIRESKK